MDTTTMVLIPAGPFLMGGIDGGSGEMPQHEVTLSPYKIDQSPVTNAQFSLFVADSGHVTGAERQGKGSLWMKYTCADRDNHPVVCVWWEDALAYANWAGKRLPTEAEWEKAARGGLVGKQYPWGDAPPADQCNWNRVCKEFSLPTSAVLEFPPNGYGLYDMSGNVWEWCLDWYADEYYLSDCSVDPQGPSSGAYKVRRGASWNVREAFRLRCANRGAIPQDSSHPNVGFRCALSV
jgi:sulfatase modifying factor 1